MSDAGETLARVRMSPAFRRFSDVVGARILRGRSIEALRMLVAVGASPKKANEIVEGWPTSEADARIPGMAIAEEAACRLAHFVDRLEAHGWEELLKRAERAVGTALAPSRPGT